MLKMTFKKKADGGINKKLLKKKCMEGIKNPVSFHDR